MNLHVVPDQPTAIIPIYESIPSYEGMPVHSTKVVIGSVANLDFANAVACIDDIVRVVVECRVVGVTHTVDGPHLHRVHRLKPLSAELTPWNEHDPTDTGVVS